METLPAPPHPLYALTSYELSSSQDPYEQWFRESVREGHGVDLTQGMPLPELIADYRRAP